MEIQSRNPRASSGAAYHTTINEPVPPAAATQMDGRRQREIRKAMAGHSPPAWAWRLLIRHGSPAEPDENVVRPTAGMRY